MSRSFKIPDDFRAFMREVASKVDWGDRAELVGPEALTHDCGRGGLVPGGETFRFTYLEKDNTGRWEIELRAQQIRDIAGGILDEIDAVPWAEGTRVTRGDALLVWGEYDDDALRVRSPSDLGVALDGVFALSTLSPCSLRLWSTGDEQAVAVMSAPDCALYVVSGTNYGRAVGDPTRTDTIDFIDHDMGPLQIPGSDCLPWRVARAALLRFAERGELGDGVILDGSMPTSFLMLGDFDRDAELATRREPPSDPALSSLPRKAPQGEWARRLVDSLLELQLIEIDMDIVDAIVARVTVLLIQRGNDAIDSPDGAQTLAKDLERIRGIGALFATGGDLQIALRRTQDPPTQPVEVPVG